MEELKLAYYGNVFQASGYGNAARAYIHALHSAGVELSVVDLAANGRAVRDDLVESLLGRKLDADLHLFHGIPPQWARMAFRMPNTIGMTVWETDRMPAQWRGILSHVREVWLPCEFNVGAFSRELRTPIFRLPHPVLPRQIDGVVPEPDSFLNVTAGDFVFYSMFEWQERKGPLEIMAAFLRAFPEENDAVLVLKVNPGACDAACRALEAARVQAPSRARVEIRCEPWNEAQVEALHARGDCYVSLHRGEGWCYPLFEAACRGKPAIATAYSGPLDYLDPEAHYLIPYQLAPVRQAYAYYNPRMHWAEPDVARASDTMRSVYADRAAARDRAAQAAIALRRKYSLESVGAMARNRLAEVLKQRQPDRSRRIEKARETAPYRPPVPVPGEWFDADYFERGLKSNWKQGYHWKDFGGLFREAAGFLAAMFPDARTYFDAGCAKGFLVRTLREAGLEAWGCDVSAWAIDNAELAARPYLECAPAESFAWERDYDVLAAFHLLAHMTEEQIAAFLTRARPHVKTALVAVIPLFETENARGGDTGDAAHITRQSRAWWHERIQAPGWCQDPLHQAMQQVCQRHPLPARMGWELFVYSPGR